MAGNKNKESANCEENSLQGGNTVSAMVGLDKTLLWGREIFKNNIYT